MATEQGQVQDYDLIVIGSGAAGLSAAVTAAYHGLKVLVLEKAPVIGGTTAWSGGWIWAPRNHLAAQQGIRYDYQDVETYLRNVVKDQFNPERVSAFLHGAPQMVAFFHRYTALQFDSGLHIPDTYSLEEGAGTGGRSVIAKPYDGRKLGKWIRCLRKPLPETTFHGLTIQAGVDLKHFMNVTRSVGSFCYVAKRVSKHIIDLALYRRGMQLRNGLSLAARLLRSALDLGVRFETNCRRVELILRDGQVRGVTFIDDCELPRICHAAKGVVLATGGFAHDKERVDKLFPQGVEHKTLAVPTATGDGLNMGIQAGGEVETRYPAAGSWCPVSLVPKPGQPDGVFPHIIDRGKPGIIGVLQDGRRFCNEGMGYYDYVKHLIETAPQGQAAQSWLICDHTFQRRYGLGVARPAPLPVGRYIESGYLIKADSITELAQKCGIDVQGLEQTIQDWNSHAREGQDPQFHRGETAYTRLQGDASHQPNPCVAPIERGPFYAVRVITGSFGTFAGLKSDGQARVLNTKGEPIPGLYAAGCDLASVMGGQYPAGGINLGPALTFGYLAARNAAGVTDWEVDLRGKI